MFETPEYSSTQEKRQRKSVFDYVKRFQAAHKNLMKRADDLKGKDEPRRRELLKKAAAMENKTLTSNQVRRSALYAEIDLLLDEQKAKGKGNGRKK